MPRKRNRSSHRARATTSKGANGLTRDELKAARAKRKRQIAPLLLEDRPQALERNGYVYVKRLDPQRGWEVAEYTVASYKRHEDYVAAVIEDVDQQDTVRWLHQQR